MAEDKLGMENGKLTMKQRIHLLFGLGITNDVRASLVFLLLFVHSVVSTEASPQTRNQLDDICKSLDNSYQCAQAIERHQLRKPVYKRVVVRARDGLRVRLRSGW